MLQPSILPSLGLTLLALCALATSLPAQTPATPKPKKKEKPPIIFVLTDYELVDAFPGLKFDQPLAIVSAPGDKTRLFIVEKTGRIQVITALDTDHPQKQLFLDLTHPSGGATLVTEGECGVLGLAFPPDHATSHRCFVYYSLRLGGVLHQRLSRFTLSANDPSSADPATEQPLFTQQDPASNHNGGDLHFGPDGFLYITVGDGGAADDKFDNARYINKGFHAAILRIDVNKTPGSLPPNPHPAIALDARGSAFYAVPSDNPFIGATTHHGETLDPKTIRTEIWATGLRNPWRISFDLPTGRLFCGDVGQNLYEEIDIITPGGDYGWSYREALHPFITGPGKDKEPAGFHPTDPIFEYLHTIGLSVTGGVVYHGSKFPQHQNKYIFADYVTGRVIALKDEGQPTWSEETLAQDPAIAGIGLDPRNGELLFANLATGQLKRLQLKSAPAPSN
ncbi:PQQ-dependent sugar dehydrogenase [Prosthecobacter sp.]|uniref:PQQ-dependent sugar dehydrogenase n=1 Tax=Prosthecobacter sp. TaxID=1965333 RepID=UPI0037847CE7